jgi:hypothetical protein
MNSLRSPFDPRFLGFDRPSIGYAIGLPSAFYRLRSPFLLSPYNPRRIEAPLSALRAERGCTREKKRKKEGQPCALKVLPGAAGVYGRAARSGYPQRSQIHSA